MASTVIYRDSVSQGHNKFTFSAWVKRNKIGGSQSLLGMYNNNDQRAKIRFNYNSDNKLYVWLMDGQSTQVNWYSNGEYRDCNGWYHIVVAIDTTQATASNRCKVYVNGEQLTGNTSGQDIVQNSTTMIFGHSKHSIGNSYYNGAWESQYFHGIMSHVHCCYGYAYQASDFGSTDSTTGEWKINTSPSVSYGTNGFFILKDGNSTTDQSGNNISLTTNGTLTKTEDNPSNVFATMNTLNKEIGGSTLTLGNLKLVTTAQGGGPYTGRTVATLGASSGKYYWEVKPTTTPSSTYPVCAIVGEDFNVHDSSGYLSGNNANSKSYITFKMSGGDVASNFTGSRSQTSYGNSVTANDIVGVALDLDNGKVFFSINGTWQNSGDPANGTNPASSSVGSLGGDIVFPAFGDENYSSSATLFVNFGNGYFGTTAVSSAGTNASNIGIFEYDVPTGFTALSTKGLNE